jgi:hypothetical protein
LVEGERLLLRRPMGAARDRLAAAEALVAALSSAVRS